MTKLATSVFSIVADGNATTAMALAVAKDASGEKDWTWLDDVLPDVEAPLSSPPCSFPEIAVCCAWSNFINLNTTGGSGTFIHFFRGTFMFLLIYNYSVYNVI